MDTLVLAIDVQWPDESPLNVLREMRTEAESNDTDCPAWIQPRDGSARWFFTVKPHGAKGYAWILESGEMTLKVGDWVDPMGRPSIMAEIRSEALWTHGAGAMADRIVRLIDAIAGRVVVMKISRVDLCADVLLPAEAWHRGLLDHVVTRAAFNAPYFHNRTLTGIQIGKGEVMARLYDKPLEIRQKSHKDWMYDVWKIESVADDHRIIRVEFQLKREALQELGIDTLADLTEQMASLWSYCTNGWLRVVQDASKHATRQTTLDWWRVVQTALPNVAQAFPLIRAKAIRSDEQRMAQQIAGYVVSMAALLRQGEMIDKDEILDLASHLKLIASAAKDAGLSDAEFTERVKRKQAKMIRHQEKFAQASSVRESVGRSRKLESRRRNSPL